MITYVIKAKKNPITKTVKYYPQVAPVTPLVLDDVVDKISGQCTVTEHDIKAVLSALQEQIIVALREGNSVRLGDLGSFRLTINGTGADTREAVTADDIKRLRVRYTMSARLRASLLKGQRGVRFSLPSAANDGENTEETGA